MSSQVFIGHMPKVLGQLCTTCGSRPAVEPWGDIQVTQPFLLRQPSYVLVTCRSPSLWDRRVAEISCCCEEWSL